MITNCDIYVLVKYLLKQFSTTLKILDKREHQQYNVSKNSISQSKLNWKLILWLEILMNIHSTIFDFRFIFIPSNLVQRSENDVTNIGINHREI